jgi:RHS repeat-associated protein
MGFGVTNSFNNLNQIVSGIWTGGAITVAGAVNYAAGTVTVNSVTGRIFPDRIFEVTNVTVTAGTNILTAIYHGPAFTNTQMIATDKVTVIVGSAAYTHDANGNLTGDQNFTYQYDLANRLTNVISKASGSSLLGARYNGLGRRVEVTRNGATVERYVYLPGSFLVLAVLDGSNAVKEFYTHGPDLSGAVGGAGGIGGILSVTTNINDSTARKYQHADSMGNVILVSDSDGKLVAAYSYTPFGKLVSQVGDFKARFLFSSKEIDAETGLGNFGLRYAHLSTGRFLSRDPIQEEGGVNIYQYCYNNPASYVDPDGRSPILVAALAGAAWTWLSSADYANAPTLDQPQYAAEGPVPAIVGTTLGFGAGALAGKAVGAIGSKIKCPWKRYHYTSEGNVAAKSLPDSYAGIRQASQYLQEMGVSRADRVRYLQSFEPQNMVVRQAGQSEFGIRYFSDPSRAGGQYLFETFPASRASMAIKPEWSSMSGFRQFQIRPGATILEGRAAAQGPYLPGGQMQKFILDWRSDLIP